MATAKEIQTWCQQLEEELAEVEFDENGLCLLQLDEEVPAVLQVIEHPIPEHNQAAFTAILMEVPDGNYDPLWRAVLALNFYYRESSALSLGYDPAENTIVACSCVATAGMDADIFGAWLTGVADGAEQLAADLKVMAAEFGELLQEEAQHPAETESDPSKPADDFREPPPIHV